MALAQLGEIATYRFCETFPSLDPQTLLREHLLVTIKSVFDEGIEVVLVQGKDGSGKTTLLAQFAQYYSPRTISLFLRPTSFWTYNPMLARHDLCNQLSVLLRGRELSEETPVDEALLNNLVYQLQNRARRNKQLYYFVIDGLDEVHDQDREAASSIMGMLPFGFSQFRFLLSGNLRDWLTSSARKLSIRDYQLPFFSLDETIRYFEDLHIPSECLEQLHKSLKGFPGYLAEIRRTVLQGKKCDELLLDVPDGIERLFEEEWQGVVVGNNQLLVMILALLAYDRQRYVLQDLSDLLGVPLEEIREWCTKAKILTIDDRSFVDFVSEPWRKFAQKKLHPYRDAAFDRVIENLLQQPSTDRAQRYLATYLQKRERWSDVLSFLGEDTMEGILKRAQALSTVLHVARSGLVSAEKLHDDTQLIRFALYVGSLLDSVEPELVGNAIRARVGVGDYAGALHLAHGATPLEQRFRLLVMVAKSLKDVGQDPPIDLIDEIRALYQKVDHEALGVESVPLALDLVHVAPDLALDLVQRSAGSGVRGNELDWALAALSITMASSGRRDFDDTLASLASRIGDPVARLLATEASLAVANWSAKQVLEEVGRFENPADRLFLLGQWAVTNRERSDAIEVMEAGMDLVVGAHDYAPNATVVRRLATPLPFVSDNQRAMFFVQRVDALAPVLMDAGPTVDYVRLQLLLAESEARRDPEACSHRLLQVFWLCNEVEDVSVKAECLEHLLDTTERLNRLYRVDEHEKIRFVVPELLEENIHIILSNTAEQFLALKGFLRIAAKTRPIEALSLCGKLNVEWRRDLARREVVESLLRSRQGSDNLSVAVSAIQGIADAELKDRVALDAVRNVFQNSNAFKESSLHTLLELCRGIRDSRLSLLAYSYVYRLCNKTQQEELARTTYEDLRSAWLAIDDPEAKVKYGYQAVSIIAKEHREQASRLLHEIDKFRTQVDQRVGIQTLDPVINTVRLASRAYGGLVRAKLSNDDDLVQLEGLISRLPSKRIRLLLWAEVAEHAYCSGSTDGLKTVVSKYIRPILDSIAKAHQPEWEGALVRTAPVLYLYHKSTALKKIEMLPVQQRQEAYSAICSLILYKTPVSDPYYSGRAKRIMASFEEILDAVELLELMGTDDVVFSWIAVICQAMSDRQARTAYSQEQRLTVAARLTDIAQRFPFEGGIQHLGYRIAALAQIGRITDTLVPDWSALVAEAKKVPNKSDVAFVLSVIAECLPEKRAAFAKQLIEGARLIIGDIPYAYDRMDRLAVLAHSALMANQVDCAKDLLRQAMCLRPWADDVAVYSVRRRIVDIAYSIDRDLASSFASLSDADPARVWSRALRNHVDRLRMRKEFVEKASEQTTITKSRDLGRVAWRLLGELNAQETLPSPMERLRPYVKEAASLGLSEGYPVMALALQNAILKYARTPQKGIIREMFSAVVLGARLCASVEMRRGGFASSAEPLVFGSSELPYVIVNPGEREKAIDFLRSWMEAYLKDYLKIWDPYFGPDDLDLIKLIQSIMPSCRIAIVSSWKYNKEFVRQPWRESYTGHWATRVSSYEPPDTEIVIVGVGNSGKAPIHDRWWITRDGGLEIGTSWNGLGVKSASKIRVLSAQECCEQEAAIDKYLVRRERQLGDQMVYYESFTLGGPL